MEYIPGKDKTPEEIKRGLEIAKTNCLYVECCEDICPYNKNCDVNEQDVMAEIPREMVSDSLAYIQQLEQDNAQKDERIRKLEQRVPRWISVEERLPGDQRSILTVNGHGLIRIMGLLYKVGDKWNWIHNERIKCYNDITHWMPLPEPPEEVDE